MRCLGLEVSMAQQESVFARDGYLHQSLFHYPDIVTADHAGTRRNLLVCVVLRNPSNPRGGEVVPGGTAHLVCLRPRTGDPAPRQGGAFSRGLRFDPSDRIVGKPGLRLFTPPCAAGSVGLGMRGNGFGRGRRERRQWKWSPRCGSLFGEGQTPGNEQQNANKYQRKPSTPIIEASSDASNGTALLSPS
jgi:hypothetical protein